jgi:Family of unknown function (DUF6262)
VTQAPPRKPADVLHDARRRDSNRKRQQVFRAVDDMRKAGVHISFAAVARQARVSQWLVYAPGVREYIEAAQQAQSETPLHAQREGRVATDASLRADLALAREDNKRLRSEVDRLKHLLREGLGSELEAESSQSLRRRVDELTEANARYRTENIRLGADVDDARAQLRLVEDDLTAARTSLRQMIKEQSQHLPAKS